MNIWALVQRRVYAQTLKVMMKGAGFGSPLLAEQPLRAANAPSGLRERWGSGGTAPVRSFPM